MMCLDIPPASSYVMTGSRITLSDAYDLTFCGEIELLWHTVRVKHIRRTGSKVCVLFIFKGIDP
jgi:hypothetical protein